MSDRATLLNIADRMTVDVSNVSEQMMKLATAARTLGQFSQADIFESLIRRLHNIHADVSSLKHTISNLANNPFVATDEVIEKLIKLRGFVSYENASFSFESETVTSDHPMQPEIKNMPIDKLIKDHTRLHRETWALPLIDELLKTVGDKPQAS